MTDLRERLGVLDDTRAPDLWPDINEREPSRPPVHDGSGGRRIMVAVLALAVATAAIAFTAHAFFGRGATTVGVQPGPKANGKIAFLAGTAVYRVPGGSTVGLYEMNPDGSSVTRIRNDLQGVGGLSWSPDGKHLTFSQSGGEFTASNVFVMDGNGSGLSQITNGTERAGQFGDQNITPAWSPDGTLIAFASAQDLGDGIHGYSIEVMRPDGSDVHRLTSCNRPCTGGDVAPTWSPDGSRLAFIRGGDLMVVNANGSDVHVVLSCRTPACFGDESPSWSPRGDEIAFVWGHDPHYRIDAVAPDGSGHHTIYDCVAPCAGVVGPSWSPDGMKLVFTYIDDSPGVRRDVYVVRADGSGLTKLTSGGLEACCASWQPVPPDRQPPASLAAFLNGEIWARVGGGDGASYVYSIEPDGTGQTLLYGDGRDPAEPSSTVDPARVGEDYAWSPDGTRLAFMHYVGTGYEIFTMAADGSDLTQVTHDGGIDSGPSWSPDGTRLVYARAAPNPEAPTGCWASYLCPSDLFVINVDGTGEVQLTNDAGDESEPTWSPDGTRITFSHEIGEGPREIFVMNADGSNVTQLTHAQNVQASPSWSPDGAHIVYLADDRDRFEAGIIDADGGNQRAFLPEGVQGLVDVAWSPDGAELALSATDAQTGSTHQIWVSATDGSGAHQVSHFDLGVGNLAWRPILGSDLAVCDFDVGDTIRRGGVGAAVPPPGQGVVGTADGITKSSTIQIETSLAGIVTIQPGNERCRLPEAP